MSREDIVIEHKISQEEMLNLRSFYGRLLKKIWIVPLGTLIGALIAVFIYFLVTVVFGPAKQYQASSEVYLHFASDEKGEAYAYYNGYTWNNQLMPSDEIMNATMDNLKKVGIAELPAGSTTKGSMKSVSRDEVGRSIDASILSDIRILRVTVTNHDKELSAALLKATDDALVAYGSSRSEFSFIETIKEDSTAKLVTFSNRTVTAGVTGAITGFVLCALTMLFIDLFNDAIYVPEDEEARYHLPVIGIFPQENQKLDSRYRNELLAQMMEISQQSSRICIISMKDKEGLKDASKVTDTLKELLGTSTFSIDLNFIPSQLPGSDLDAYRKIHDSDGVIIAIPSGKRVGSFTKHCISQLYKHECPILGIIITDMDMKFLKWYYRL